MAQPAEVAAARRKVKQALDACRTASQRLAQAQTIDVYGQRSCQSEHDITAATELIRLALCEHDQVDVVVLASPR
jgi:hypothetical protein